MRRTIRAVVIAVAICVPVLASAQEQTVANKRVTTERPKLGEAGESVEKSANVPGVGSAIGAGIDAIGPRLDENLHGGSQSVEFGLKKRVEASNGGYLEVELLRGEATANGEAGTLKNGVKASGAANIEATVASVKGDTGRVVAGTPEIAAVDGKASGEANVRGRADVRAKASATTHAVEAAASGTAFIGARAAGSVDGKASLCGVSVVGKGDGEVSVGAGASASANFTIDWTNLKFRIGANAAAAAGVGAGLGGDVTVSLEALKKNPAQAGACALVGVEKVAGPKAAKAVEQTATAVIASGTKVVEETVKPAAEKTVAAVKGLVQTLPGSAAQTGSNVARDATTTGRAAAGSAANAVGAAGAGLLR